LKSTEAESAAMRYRRPSLQEWALLVVSLAFCAMGVAALSTRPDIGIITLSLFGGCGIVFGRIIQRRIRYRRYRSGAAEVVGGVRIRPARARFLLMSAWMVWLAIAVYGFGYQYPTMFRWLCYLIGAVGIALALGVALGRIPPGFMQFDPDGLTIGYRGWQALIPWNRIVRIAEGEISHNPVLMLWIDDAASLTIQPVQATERARRKFAANARWSGADLTIMASRYAIDLPLLTDAVSRYVLDPYSRTALSRRVLPGKPI
jgi:hypothetical protein